MSTEDPTDSEELKRFNERMDNGNLAFEALRIESERNSVPPRPKIGNTDLKPVNDEITPVDWGLELSPEEVKQGIKEQEDRNTLDDLIIGTIRISPKTQLATYKWSAIASLLALILKVSGCV